MRSSFRSMWKCVVVNAILVPIGVAHAQSSVTLYGMLDAGFLYANRTPGSTGKNAGPTFAIDNGGLGPSVFGLRGSEDLGGGMKAEFDLESGISTVTGGIVSSNGYFLGRQAWIGLEGNFGKIRLGVQHSPFFQAAVDLDPRHSTFGSSILPYDNNVRFTSMISSNAVLYTTPNLAGLTGTVMFAPGGVAGDFSAGRQWSGGLKYDDGSFMVDAAIYDSNAGGAVTPIPTDIEFTGRMLGVAYRFGALTTKVSFTNYKVAGAFNSNVYGGGVDYFARSDLELNGGVWVTSDRNDTANHSLLAAVGTTYFLSRRTSVYLQFGRVDNHGAMDTGLSLTYKDILTEIPGTTYGVNIGMRHFF